MAPPPPLTIALFSEPVTAPSGVQRNVDSVPEASLLNPRRFVPAYGAGVLGRAIGMGVGFLGGSLVVPDRFDENPADDEDDVRYPMPVLGLWFGSTIGVLVATNTEPNPRRTPLWLAGVGSFFGSVVGAVVANSLSDSSGPIVAAGGALGAATGAVGGLAIWERAEWGRW